MPSISYKTIKFDELREMLTRFKDSYDTEYPMTYEVGDTVKPIYFENEMEYKLNYLSMVMDNDNTPSLFIEVDTSSLGSLEFRTRVLEYLSSMDSEVFEDNEYAKYEQYRDLVYTIRGGKLIYHCGFFFDIDEKMYTPISDELFKNRVSGFFLVYPDAQKMLLTQSAQECVNNINTFFTNKLRDIQNKAGLSFTGKVGKVYFELGEFEQENDKNTVVDKLYDCGEDRDLSAAIVNSFTSVHKAAYNIQRRNRHNAKISKDAVKQIYPYVYDLFKESTFLNDFFNFVMNMASSMNPPSIEEYSKLVDYSLQNIIQSHQQFRKNTEENRGKSAKADHDYIMQLYIQSVAGDTYPVFIDTAVFHQELKEKNLNLDSLMSLRKRYLYQLLILIQTKDPRIKYFISSGDDIAIYTEEYMNICTGVCCSASAVLSNILQLRELPKGSLAIADINYSPQKITDTLVDTAYNTSMVNVDIDFSHFKISMLPIEHIRDAIHMRFHIGSEIKSKVETKIDKSVRYATMSANDLTGDIRCLPAIEELAKVFDQICQEDIQYPVSVQRDKAGDTEKISEYISKLSTGYKSNSTSAPGYILFENFLNEVCNVLSQTCNNFEKVVTIYDTFAVEVNGQKYIGVLQDIPTIEVSPCTTENILSDVITGIEQQAEQGATEYSIAPTCTKFSVWSKEEAYRVPMIYPVSFLDDIFVYDAETEFGLINAKLWQLLPKKLQNDQVVVDFARQYHGLKYDPVYLNYCYYYMLASVHTSMVYMSAIDSVSTKIMKDENYQAYLRVTDIVNTSGKVMTPYGITESSSQERPINYMGVQAESIEHVMYPWVFKKYTP